MQITLEAVQEHIPSYLTRPQQEELARALAGFPAKMNYYTTKYGDELLQGDGWSALQLIHFETGERKGVKGIILSNSCDVDPQNKRDLPARVIFAPVIQLEVFIASLLRRGVAETSISAKIQAIKEQKVTSIFFLPKGGVLEADYIVVLDDVHTMPAKLFWEDASKAKLFTLSQAGFYLFVLKLSVHLCRFHENVDRG